MSEAIARTSDILTDYTHIPRATKPWSQPEMFDLSLADDQIRLEARLEEGGVDQIHDPFIELAQSLCEYKHPETKGNPAQQEEFIRSVAKEGEAFGTWVYFPWSGTLSRFPDREDHQNLRTSRNRNLITAEEQSTLLNSTIAVLGLSVGSKALSSLVESGIGGKYIIADGDYLDPTNTNRIDAGYVSVGESKVDIAAKKISEKDPWVRQVHMREGMRPEDAGTLAEANLIVEEVDNLAVKALVRLIADRHDIPLVMAADIADKSVIDIERYDLNDGNKIMFNGRISREVAEKISLGNLSPGENSRYMLKHAGVRHLSTRMMQSVMAMNTEIGGLPQLGMTATKGGAHVAFVAREILLGHKMPSGRYAESFRHTFRLPRFESPVTEGIRTIHDLIRHAKSL